MKKTILIMMFAAWIQAGVVGCNQSAPSQNSEQNAGAAKAEAPAAIAEKTEEQKQEDLKRMKKLVDEGRVLPPITTIKLSIIGTDGGLSIDDGYRSYEFRKSAIKRCYLEALSYDESLKGEIPLKLKHAGVNQTSIEDYKSDMTSENFEPCFKKAISTWPMPENSSMDIQLSFTNRPAPNRGELKKYQGRGGHNHPEHTDPVMPDADHRPRLDSAEQPSNELNAPVKIRPRLREPKLPGSAE